jgi:hypothetical protein
VLIALVLRTRILLIALIVIYLVGREVHYLNH